MLYASGIGTHIRGIFQALHSSDFTSKKPEFHLVGNRRNLLEYDYMQAAEITEFDAPVYSLREQLLFPRPRVDFWHIPHYNVARRLSAPFAVTIHDLIHLLIPEVLHSAIKMKYARFLMTSAARRARLIFTISQFSRDRIIEHLGADPARIVIVPNAVSPSWKALPIEDVNRARKLNSWPQRFILAVGVNKPHKNFPWLIRSFAQWNNRKEISLVICGVKPHNVAPLISLTRECGVMNSVVFIPYVRHEELPALYQSAEALVFPSLQEGFGIPILEAQKLGVPVLTSNTSSMPEVAGDAALYFDPADSASLLQSLDRLFSETDLASLLREKGVENEKRFHWSDAARITIEAYEQFFS
jgi:glycosyltransferase involved in cell wall biosynthesis